MRTGFRIAAKRRSQNAPKQELSRIHPPLIGPRPKLTFLSFLINAKNISDGRPRAAAASNPRAAAVPGHHALREGHLLIPVGGGLHSSSSLCTQRRGKMAVLLPGRHHCSSGVAASEVAVLVAGAHQSVHDAGLLGAVARVCSQGVPSAPSLARHTPPTREGGRWSTGNDHQLGRRQHLVQVPR